jgi:hypothetical protein
VCAGAGGWRGGWTGAEGQRLAVAGDGPVSLSPSWLFLLLCPSVHGRGTELIRDGSLQGHQSSPGSLLAGCWAPLSGERVGVKT